MASSSAPASSDASSMAIHVDAAHTGLWEVTQSDAVAEKVSSLLTEDLIKHHVFFNDFGFHNHITHHLLSLYGTGAPSSSLQEAYDNNKGYQRRAKPPHSSIRGQHNNSASQSNTGPTHITHSDWYENHAASFLGHHSYYPDFMNFFLADMDRHSSDGDGSLKGWQRVLLERVFAGTPAADDLLIRLHAGFVHPLIQLMYGIEWGQPIIVAQGLSSAAAHRHAGLDKYLAGAEKLAIKRQGNASAGGQEATGKTTGKTTTLLSLYQEVAANERIRSAVRAGSISKLQDSVLANASEDMVDIAAKVHVEPTEAAVAERTAEMAETCLFMAASAARHPRKHVKFDFFLIHHVNAVPFYFALNSFAWVPAAAKARLLEWKIRADLLEYADRGCPPLSLDGIRSYSSPGALVVSAKTQSLPSGISGDAVAAAARLFHFDEDGHAIKLIRATGLIEKAVKPYSNAPWRLLTPKALWSRVYHMEVDSVLGPGSEWVRSAGLEEAWRSVPDEPRYEARV